LEVLKSNRSIDKVFILEGEREGSLQRIAAIAKERGLVIIQADRRRLDTMSQTGAHQGVILYCSAKEYVSLEEILQIAKQREEAPFLVICDEITDPHNLGAIIRTAVAAGAHGIVIPKRRSVGITPVVYKSSAGMAENIAIAKVANICAAMDTLKKNGVWIYGADMDGEKDCWAVDYTGGVGIVIGSEGSGISRLVREKCDFLVKIPMAGGVASLNASVAGAILMYEVFRQKRPQG
jgi:23S rRNA (guanosine2251-2'-O)-methyltransferase